jgi:hypothetical protein
MNEQRLLETVTASKAKQSGAGIASVAGDEIHRMLLHNDNIVKQESGNCQGQLHNFIKLLT